jgi:hypothetical protein
MGAQVVTLRQDEWICLLPAGHDLERVSGSAALGALPTL